MQPIIYTSQDTDAPQLSSTAGALNTVIKGCLATGYGVKPSAGWDIAHEDMTTKKLALRSKNPKSIKSVYLFSDATIYNDINIKAFDDWDAASASGIRMYADRYGVVSERVANNKWVVIATDSFVWLWISGDTTMSFGTTIAFGDLKTISAATNGCSALIAYATSSFSYGNMVVQDIATSNGIARMSQLPIKTNYASALGGYAVDYDSEVYVFTDHVCYRRNTANKWEPAYILPGLLMPWMTILQNVIPKDSRGLQLIKNQFPFTNPLICLNQAFHGSIVFHTDDWGI